MTSALRAAAVVLACLGTALGVETLSAQALLVSPQLILHAPTRDFLDANSGFRTKFGVSAGVEATVRLRATRHFGLTLHGFTAQPNYNYSVPDPGGYNNHTRGRVAGLGLQASGIIPLSAKSNLVASLGPTLLRQKSRTRPQELTWTTYSSLGLTTSLQYEHRIGNAVYGVLGLAYHTYQSDVDAIPGDTPEPGRRQHDLMISVGLGWGFGGR